jgi:hypothetical protein
MGDGLSDKLFFTAENIREESTAEALYANSASHVLCGKKRI